MATVSCDKTASGIQLAITASILAKSHPILCVQVVQEDCMLTHEILLVVCIMSK